MDYTVTIQEETEKVTQAVVHKSVEITDGQYGHYIYKKDEMIYIPCGGAVYVKNSITEVETCKQYLTLYFDSGDGKRRTILFPREDLVENKIVSLTAYGVQVSKKTADYLIKSIENQEVNVKHLLCHAKLGMAEWNGEKIFKGAKGVGIDSKYVSAKYSCGFSNTLISSIIVGERYLDYFTTITEDRLWQLLAKPVFRWRNRSGLSMNAAKAV